MPNLTDFAAPLHTPQACKLGALLWMLPLSFPRGAAALATAPPPAPLAVAVAVAGGSPSSDSAQAQPQPATPARAAAAAAAAAADGVPQTASTSHRLAAVSAASGHADTSTAANGAAPTATTAAAQHAAAAPSPNASPSRRDSWASPVLSSRRFSACSLASSLEDEGGGAGASRATVAEAIGAAARSKWPSWRGHSWPPPAPLIPPREAAAFPPESRPR